MTQQTGTPQTTSFVDLGKQMWSYLTGKGAAINYEFVDMTIEVPRETGSDAPRATWKPERHAAHHHRRGRLARVSVHDAQPAPQARVRADLEPAGRRGRLDGAGRRPPDHRGHHPARAGLVGADRGDRAGRVRRRPGTR
ncbi:hypothetical protein GCM10025868_44990 [Angustibacter aerolatus]|uniref:Uncharacterized protein n=1 Tax=Angustibacter aerolatus TaxID=1162965 RepID=A0ABQ6JMV0_9ACTN|nr:hypothetical protein [Angustibacter aerolatus]GMA89249.1 hypothetical protein GCM10025868_44990 [Angustibacter aerolatus]